MARLPLGLAVLLCAWCGISGVRIINCNNNKVEIFEDSSDPVTCANISSTATVDWRSNAVSIGECSADGTCTNFLNNYNINRSPMSTESHMTPTRDNAGKNVTCEDRLTSSSSDCTLVIKHRSVLSECQVSITNVNWTVSGSCRVQEAFSSDGNYSCTWTLNDRETFGGFDASRELCSFTQALPQAGGLYTYSISVSPPATTNFSQQLTLGVEGPGDVVISETRQPGSNGSSVVTLSCSITGAVSPVVTFTWSASVCYNETHHTNSSTCTILLDAENDGKSVRCMAVNSIDNRISISRLVTLRLDKTENVNGGTKIDPPAVNGPVAGAVVAVLVTAPIAIFLVIFITRRRRHLEILHEASPKKVDEIFLVSRESQLYPALTYSSDNHGVKKGNKIEEGAETQMTTGNEYENIQTLADKTYDTPCTLYEEHQYADLKVKATGEVEVTKEELLDNEERDSAVYINV